MSLGSPLESWPGPAGRDWLHDAVSGVCTAVAGMSDWGCRPQDRWEAPGIPPASPYRLCGGASTARQVPAAAGGGGGKGRGGGAGAQHPGRAAPASALLLHKPTPRPDAQACRWSLCSGSGNISKPPEVLARPLKAAATWGRLARPPGPWTVRAGWGQGPLSANPRLSPPLTDGEQPRGAE